MDRLSREAREQAFEDHGGLLLKFIERTQNSAKELLKEEKEDQYTTDDVARIVELKPAIVEAERYNNNKFDGDPNRVNVSVLKDRIFSNSSGSVQQVDAYRTVIDMCDREEERVLNDSTLSEKERAKRIESCEVLKAGATKNLVELVDIIENSKDSFYENDSNIDD